MRKTKPETLAVSEVFISLQGEGINVGRPSLFIRLGGCNLHCGVDGAGDGWHCDSLNLWKASKSMSFDELYQVVLNELMCFYPAPEIALNEIAVVVTGGEPLLQLDAITCFLERVSRRVGLLGALEFETNGTIVLPLSVARRLKRCSKQTPTFNCSAKLAGSGESKERRYVPHALRSLANAYSFRYINLIYKFVVATTTDILVNIDIKEIKHLFLDDPITECSVDNMLIMPAAASRDDLITATSKLWNRCLSLGWTMTTRLHIVAFDRRQHV